ncbi:MAG: hypothetical protein ACMXYF_01505 [Candidatus Woesearchaeota archaeon]
MGLRFKYGRNQTVYNAIHIRALLIEQWYSSQRANRSVSAFDAELSFEQHKLSDRMHEGYYQYQEFLEQFSDILKPRLDDQNMDIETGLVELILDNKPPTLGLLRKMGASREQVKTLHHLMKNPRPLPKQYALAS